MHIPSLTCVLSDRDKTTAIHSTFLNGGHRQAPLRQFRTDSGILLVSAVTHLRDSHPFNHLGPVYSFMDRARRLESAQRAQEIQVKAGSVGAAKYTCIGLSLAILGHHTWPLFK